MTVKKLAALLLTAALALSLAACDDGSESSSPGAPSADTYKLGDTVSTDIFEFTLDTAELAIALDNGKRDLDGNIKDTYMMPKEYDASNDSNNPFVASKGHTFVSITYTVSNLDRAFVNFNDAEEHLFSIEYNGTKYTPDIVNGLYRVYSESYLMDDSGTIETIEPNVWHEFDLNYYSVGLEVGDTETRRFYVDIPTDVESLTDDFSVIISIPNSDGTKTEFTYLITD